MRVDPCGVGSIVHVVKRGARGMDIVRDDQDKERFARSLFYLNDEYRDDEWHAHTADLRLPLRPLSWPERRPLVHVLAWTLMPNHFHLLLEEIREGGIATFMQRLGGSMSLVFNAKYGGTGSIFQSSYKGRTIDSDEYLNYVLAYIVAKNVLELHPKGLRYAETRFDQAWDWAVTYPYSSLSAYMGDESPIVQMERISDHVRSPRAFKQSCKDMVLSHIALARTDARQRDVFKRLQLEDW